MCSPDILIGPNTLELMSEVLANCKTMELLRALSKLLWRASSSIHKIGIQWNEKKNGERVVLRRQENRLKPKTHIMAHCICALCVFANIY